MDPCGAADEVLLAAARSCPTEAIALHDESTGAQVFPPDDRAGG